MIACLQGLHGRPAPEDGVGRQQEVERHPGTRIGEAAHDLRQAGNDLAVPELTGGIAPVAPLRNGEQGAGAPSLIDTFARGPEPPRGLLGRQGAAGPAQKFCSVLDVPRQQERERIKISSGQHGDLGVAQQPA
jgi:hypothetical protein